VPQTVVEQRRARVRNDAQWRVVELHAFRVFCQSPQRLTSSKRKSCLPVVGLLHDRQRLIGRHDARARWQAEARLAPFHCGRTPVGGI
jgi:hypothetical protein